ncbi:MAG TPA: hypothetical protein DF383_11035 [Deltaproteobacteria bacterium]|nr:hypothetical protein [Deltaproteobacteria bacterium]
MTPKLKIERRDEAGVSRLILQGVIDENADFSEAFSKLEATAILDLGGITLINSSGVRQWVRAVQNFPKNAKVIYEKCSPRIVEQVNYVADFLGGGSIVSFDAPYYCPKCKKETKVLLHTESLSSPKAPEQKCPNCGAMMEFDDIEEEYFSFLNLRTL